MDTVHPTLHNFAEISNRERRPEIHSTVSASLYPKCGFTVEDVREKLSFLSKFVMSLPSE